MRATRILPLFLALSVLLAGCAPASRHVRAYEEGTLTTGQVATVTVPVQLEVFEVSGFKVATPNVDHGEYTLEVPAGRQQLLLQYVASWPGGSGTDLVRSQSMSLIADFRPGGRYRLDYPAPTNRDSAERYAAAPSATLISAEGDQRVSANVRPSAQQNLFGRAPGSFRPAPPPAAPPQASSPAPAPAPAASTDNSEALNRLKYWWNHASEGERETFRQWLESGTGAP